MGGRGSPFRFSPHVAVYLLFLVVAVIALSIIVASPGLDVADLAGEAPKINPPQEPQELGYSGDQQRQYPYYEIYDQDTLEFLMVVDFRVYPGDEFLTPDNRLFHINYVEENKAYAAFIRRVRLIK